MFTHGDFTIDLINSNKHKMTEKFINLMVSTLIYNIKEMAANNSFYFIIILLASAAAYLLFKFLDQTLTELTPIYGNNI